MDTGIHDKIREYIATWGKRCYKEGIPDEAPAEIADKVPSYKKICISILKNDLRALGIQPESSKYYSILKRIEIRGRNEIGRQLDLFYDRF